MTEIEKLWREKSDDEVAEAMLQIEDYKSAAQSVIRAEHQRRGLPSPRAVDEAVEEEVLPIEDESEESMKEMAEADPLECVRCEQVLEYVGSKRFHEGANWGVFGELGELFVKRERFDVYVCTRCGKVELFVDSIGEDMRPH